VRQIRSILPVVLAGALMLALAACTSESAPTTGSRTQPPGEPILLEADCLDLEQGGQHLALDVVQGLHALDLDSAALNADFSAGHLNVHQLAWVLLGARNEKDADGVLFVYATDRTSSFPATESMRRTIAESAGTSAKVRQLDLGRTTVAGLPAETAAVTSKNGEFDAWTLTSGKTRFIVFAHQEPDAGAFDLSERVPDLFTSGSCADG
jgi:hypothetical protein